MILKIIFSRTHLLLLKIFNFVKFIFKPESLHKTSAFGSENRSKDDKKIGGISLS